MEEKKEENKANDEEKVIIFRIYLRLEFRELNSIQQI